MSPLKIIKTEDGSHSLYNQELNETYHSFHGAVNESNHVFIKMGLEHWTANNKGPCRILEVGMGTGLNVFMSAIWAIQNKVVLDVTTLEAFPLDPKTIASLNYTEKLGFAEVFDKIHQSPWGQPVVLNNCFTLHKIQDQIQNFKSTAFYDLVFFDAFAPNKQPEMWTIEILQMLADTMNENGVFVTYCAKGQLKRDLKSVGLEVTTLPGPPGKKEMVRACKKDNG